MICFFKSTTVFLLLPLQTLKMAGTKDVEKEKSQKPSKDQKTSIAETKKSLPIYPFKKDLIRAVRDHQILIIEGETGSGEIHSAKWREIESQVGLW